MTSGPLWLKHKRGGRKGERTGESRAKSVVSIRRSQLHITKYILNCARTINTLAIT